MPDTPTPAGPSVLELMHRSDADAPDDADLAGDAWAARSDAVLGITKVRGRP